MTFDNQVVVVTGGADGIGLAVAQRLKASGAQVVIGDVDAEKVNLKAEADGLVGVHCDVRREADIAGLVDAASALGPVDIVMANAGVAVGGRFEQIPIEEWQRLFEVNVHGVVRTINAFLPAMLERGQGRIIVTGSSAGLFRSDGFNAPYAASKHALRALTEGLAVYCKDTGVSVHYLAPRLTDTAFPKSSVAWGRKGSRVTSDHQLGDDYDTVDDVVDALFEAIESGRFLTSLTPESESRLVDYASELVQRSS